MNEMKRSPRGPEPLSPGGEVGSWQIRVELGSVSREAGELGSPVTRAAEAVRSAIGPAAARTPTEQKRLTASQRSHIARDTHTASHRQHVQRASAQYHAHSDFSKVQDRNLEKNPWSRPSTLHGQVMKLPQANSLPDHNAYSLLESAMALTTAGTTPAINGDSIRARNAIAGGESPGSDWGVQAERLSTYTDQYANRNERQNAGPGRRGLAANPHIEMRRKRFDMRMVRHQLSQFGVLPVPPPSHSSQHKSQTRLGTADRTHILNISQMSSNQSPNGSTNSQDLWAADSQFLQAGLREGHKPLSSRMRAKVLADSLGLSRALAETVNRSRLSTPELLNYISRRTLVSIKHSVPHRDQPGDPRNNGGLSAQSSGNRYLDRKSSTGHAEEKLHHSSDDHNLGRLRLSSHPVPRSDATPVCTAPSARRTTGTGAHKPAVNTERVGDTHYFNLADYSDEQKTTQSGSHGCRHPLAQAHPLSHPKISSCLRDAPKKKADFEGKRSRDALPLKAHVPVREHSSPTPWDTVRVCRVSVLCRTVFWLHLTADCTECQRSALAHQRRFQNFSALA